MSDADIIFWTTFACVTWGLIAVPISGLFSAYGIPYVFSSEFERERNYLKKLIILGMYGPLVLVIGLLVYFVMSLKRAFDNL